jgi:hypothetical protein
MDHISEFVVRAFFIGVGATIVMDVWALLLKQFGVSSLNFAFLGRWIGHLPQRQWTHKSIAKSAPIRGELWIGWFAHYFIGVTFAALLLAVYRLELARKPTLPPALIVGIVTVVSPLFILQPALGAGVASSKTPKPVFNSIKSLITHTVFGLGLYLAAVAVGSRLCLDRADRAIWLRNCTRRGSKGSEEARRYHDRADGGADSNRSPL